MADEHPLKPFYSVLVLALACSLFVSAAAVGLRPMQEANRTLDREKNILTAAGIYTPEKSTEAQFKNVEARIINLETGSYVPAEKINPEIFDQQEAARSPDSSRDLDRSEDAAGIRRLEKYALIYLVKDGDTISQAVLPVRGKGLWSTMYAYIAVDADLTTIRGISFYEHGETPGLGGEIENPRWQQQWQNKKIYTPEGQLAFKITKDTSRENKQNRMYMIDALSGATITSQGVNDLMIFWFSENGFKPFFDAIKQQGGFNG